MGLRLEQKNSMKRRLLRIATKDILTNYFMTSKKPRRTTLSPFILIQQKRFMMNRLFNSQLSK